MLRREDLDVVVLSYVDFGAQAQLAGMEQQQDAVRAGVPRGQQAVGVAGRRVVHGVGDLAGLVGGAVVDEHVPEGVARRVGEAQRDQRARQERRLGRSRAPGWRALLDGSEKGSTQHWQIARAHGVDSGNPAAHLRRQVPVSPQKVGSP